MTTKNKITIVVGGAAGQGVESGGQGLAKALSKGGAYIFGVSDYMSLIKGGHNFYNITVSDEPVHSNTELSHIYVSFDPKNVTDTVKHLKNLVQGGAFIVDDSTNLDPEIEAVLEMRPDIIRCAMPLKNIATEIGGSFIMTNTAALGGVACLMKLPFEELDGVVRQNFAKKSQELAEQNSQVAWAGYQHMQENYLSKFVFEVPYASNKSQQMLINGNEAISFGAYAAGCRFMSAYPMTPGSSAFEWFTKQNAKLGAVTKQTEDETAAICMAIGAAQMGARAMTSTSGGGFSLMVEALGLAGMTEVGMVVVEAQRGGPSTGLPTRTEQADLLFVINASQGEFPRAVLTPGTIEQCYEAGIKAHNLAEKYQMPVIILTDQLLAAEIRDVSPDSFQIPTIDRGKLLTQEQLEALEGEYLRFQFTEDGVSPRALQGHPKAVCAPATDEHDESGHITEEEDNRIRMMDKRMRKMEVARREIAPPQFVGPEDAELTLIVWGSTIGTAQEAVELHNRQYGERINLLHFSEVWPFPREAAQEALAKVKRSLNVEQNYTSQFARLMRSEIGYQPDEMLNRYDGRPICPEEIVRKSRGILESALATV